MPDDDRIDLIDDTQDAGDLVAAGPSPWRVLVVDDDEEVHEATRYALRRTDPGAAPAHGAHPFGR